MLLDKVEYNNEIVDIFLDLIDLGKGIEFLLFYKSM